MLRLVGAGYLSPDAGPVLVGQTIRPSGTGGFVVSDLLRPVEDHVAGTDQISRVWGRAGSLMVVVDAGPGGPSVPVRIDILPGAVTVTRLPSATRPFDRQGFVVSPESDVSAVYSSLAALVAVSVH